MYAEFDPNIQGARIVKKPKESRRESTKEKKSSKSKSSKSDRRKGDANPERKKSKERHRSDKSRPTDSPTKRKKKVSSDALNPSERDRSRSTRQSSDRDRDRSRSVSVASRRRSQTLGESSGGSLLGSPTSSRKSRSSQQSLVTPSRRRPTHSNINLTTPRKKESRRTKVRESWKEISKEKDHTLDLGDDKSSRSGMDDFLDQKVETSNKKSLLDKSRRGPIRASSRQRGVEGTDRDDDDDLLSIGSSSMSTSKTFLDEDLGAIAGNYIDKGSSYLPNQLNHGGQRRRNSKFGSSFDRMQALQDFKDDPLGIKGDDEEDEPEDMYGYEVPGDMDRSTRSVRSRRPSTASNGPSITLPDVSGTSYENEDHKKKGHRRILSSLSLSRSNHKHKDPVAKSPAKSSKTLSTQKDCKAVDEILKNRRLRRGSTGHHNSTRDTESDRERRRRGSMNGSERDSRRGSMNGTQSGSLRTSMNQSIRGLFSG